MAKAARRKKVSSARKPSRIGTKAKAKTRPRAKKHKAGRTRPPRPSTKPHRARPALPSRVAAKRAAPKKLAPKAVRKKARRETQKPLPPPLFPKDELAERREKLVALLKQLRTDIVQEVQTASARDLAHITDTSDMASDAADGELAFRIAETEGVAATEVQKAIDKIDGGTYGYCERCSRAINSERLQFLPFATLCVRCQSLAEIRRKEKDEEELDDLAEASEETHEEA